MMNPAGKKTFKEAMINTPQTPEVDPTGLVLAHAIWKNKIWIAGPLNELGTKLKKVSSLRGKIFDGDFC